MKFGTKLFFIFILVGFLPLLVGGFFLFYFFDGYLKEITNNNLQKITEIASLRVEDFINRSYSSVNLLKKNETLTSKESSLEEVEEELKKIHSYYQFLFQDITLLDSEGELITSTSKKSYGRWETNPWFIRAKESKEIVISDMYAVVNPEEPIIAIFAPNVNEEGELNSFIVVQIDTNSLFQDLKFKVGKDGMAILLNRKGDIIFHPNRRKLFTKMSASYPLEENALKGRGFSVFEMGGEKFVSSFTVVENDLFKKGWQLVITQSEEEAFGFLERMIIGYGFLLIVLLFPIIIFSFFLSQKVVKPLKNLSIASKRVARGDLKVKANVYSADEFGDLAENFNKMTEELESARKVMEEKRDILEIKVNARTKELNQINERLEEEVKSRTEQIQKKLVELEKMSKLMVGRELKMIELKKTLQEKEGEVERLKRGL